MAHDEEGLSSNVIVMDNNPLSIHDSRTPPLTKTVVPGGSSIGNPPQISNRSTPSRRPSVHLNPSPDRSINTRKLSPRRSKLASPVFTSLREKDDPYFLALPDASRSKLLSNSAPDLNTLPHPPPQLHRRLNRDSTIANGNGRLMEQLHSSRRHSGLGAPPQPSTDGRSIARRSSIKPPFRLQRRTTVSSGSSSPNYDSDSESEIFDDDHSNVGSTVSTRPSSFSSTASLSETFLRPSPNADGKIWKRGSLTQHFSVLDLKKQDNTILPERDHIETEDCRFLESEYQTFISLNPTQQGSILRRYLLPAFACASPLPPPSFALLTRKCTILLKYQNALLAGLAIRSLLPQHEKNAFLEAVACICERREWRDYARGMYEEANFADIAVEGSSLKGMAAALEGFREHERMSYHCVSIAMEYLCKKNFGGTAVEYCGRVLAVAFFYSPGVAVRLIHALNVATPFTARLLDEVCEETVFRDLSSHAPLVRSFFPKHLHELIYSTPQRYTSLLTTRPSPTITVDSNLTISFAGEWVHRWRAHNSDVFFSFLQHWHVILSEHLHSATAELSVATIAATPGYLVIQGHILRMVDSFIHRSSNELPVHPLPAPHHKTLTQSTLCKRAFERHTHDPLGPPLPVHLQQGNRMQDSIHAMALLMHSGDGRPQGIEKAEKKLAKAFSGVLSAVLKTQSLKRSVLIQPQFLVGDIDDTVMTSSSNTSEGDVSTTPRTVSTSDISSLVGSNKSTSSDGRISLPNLQLNQQLVSLFSVLFERTLKAAVKKTSVWEGQACFALCDLIERLIPVLDDSFAKVQDTLTCLDWPFWTDVVKKMVLQSENSVTQVRAFGFLFNMWERCPSGDDWLLEEETWELFFCHWSTIVRCYFMNLVCWRICMSSQSGVAVDPSTILLLKRRLEIAQLRNIMLIRHALANGLPIPILKASNPLPNRHLVVIASSPSRHEYGITFDSIVPASPTSVSRIEQDKLEALKPGSRGSTSTANSEAIVVTLKENKKGGFRLNIFKGIFGKSKSKKSEPLAPYVTVSPSEPVLVPTPIARSDSSPRIYRSTPRQRKREAFQFSMELILSRLDSNKGMKERPTPSNKTIEKFINPGPVPLPRHARDLICSLPSIEFTLEPSDHSKWRYAGRALAEWDVIVKQCDSYVESILRRRESIPEEVNEEDGQDGLDGSSAPSSIPSSPTVATPHLIIEDLHIPRMTVELPKFYFTGK